MSLQELKLAVRGLFKNPGFTAAALTTLALGIGATSAIFSVVSAVLLAPLPYRTPEQRVQIFSQWISFDKTWLCAQEIYDFRQARTLSGVAGWATGQQNLTGDGEPVRIGVGLVTSNAIDVLGSAPMLGRLFSPEDDRPGAAPVAILSDGLWQARFGGHRDVVGRRVFLDDGPVEVVGVMPPGFRLPTDFTAEAAEPTQLWRPLQLDEQNLQRGNHSYYAAGLLAPGQTAATATDELRAIARRLTDEGLYPAAMKYPAFAVSLDDEIRGGLRPAMALLIGARRDRARYPWSGVAAGLAPRGNRPGRRAGGGPGRHARPEIPAR